MPLTFPRIIHQTWKNNIIPKHWQISQDEWKRLHPDWTYMFWTDDMNFIYIKTHYPQFLNTYENFRYGIQRADAIRYIILKDFGGVYSDLDIVPNKSLDSYDFGDQDVYLIKSANTPCAYTNSFMISKPNIPLWNDMIEYTTNYKPEWYSRGKHLRVMLSTGPLAFTRVISKYEHTISILPATLFNSMSVKDIQDNMRNTTSYLYSITGNSWHEYDSKIINFFFTHHEILILIFILLIIYMLHTILTKNKCMKILNKNNIPFRYK